MKILITGINSGIGLALTEVYLSQGAIVYGLGRRPTPSITHDRLHYISLDLDALERIEGGIRVLLEDVDVLDLVILNAGILGQIQEMTHTTLHDIENVMRINVWANKVILDTLIAMAMPVSQIVGISSGAAINGSKGWGAYSLSKASLNMLLKLYSRELPDTHVSAIAPGVVDTPMVRHITEEVDTEKFPSAQRLKNGLIQTPEDAAERLIKAFENVRKYESGSFVDVRNMG